MLSDLNLVSVSTGGATRTPDTRFWRPMLYQLNYTRLLIFDTAKLDNFSCLARCDVGFMREKR